MSKDLALRNQMIADLYAAGKTLNDLAVQFDLTPQRIGQIVARQTPELTDDDARALTVRKLEYAESYCLDVINQGPRPYVDVKGNIVYGEDGRPLLDHRDCLNAADIMRKINAEIRHANAWDKPRRKQVPEDEARRQAEEWLRNAGIIRSEVIRDEDD